MNSIDTRRYEMLVRVRDFGAAHKALFPETSIGGQAFVAVAAAVAQLGVHAVSKMSTARDGVGSRPSSREALVDRLEVISRTAKAIAVDAPNFDDPFRLPKRQTNQALLTVGRVFVQEAEAVKAQFIAHGLSEAFVTELTAFVNTFEQALRAGETRRAAQASAQAGTEAALLAGLAALRKLDVVVANQLRNDPATLAAWERDRRIEHPRRLRHAPSSATLPSTPVPATVPAPVAAPPAAVESARPSVPEAAAGGAS